MWTRLTEDELTAPLNQKELDVYKQAGSAEGTDPVAAILKNTAAYVRGCVRSAGLVRLAPDPLAVPDDLVGAALNYARYDYLTRFRLPITEERKRAREEASNLFEMVRTGKHKVEDGVIGETAPNLTATTPAMLSDNPPYLLD